MNKKEIMINAHIKGRGITNKKVLHAFDVIDRKYFVQSSDQTYAYDDFPLKIGDNQTISQPFIVAFMTNHLDLDETDTVLEIGTGSGFQTGILAHLAKTVYTVERHHSLQEKAKQILTHHFGFSNIHYFVGDGSKGLDNVDYFDKIIVTAASETVPKALLNQLKNGGRMIIPIGSPLIQTLTLITKINNEIHTKKLLDCRFVPLISD